MKLVIATRNVHKLREIQAILNVPRLDLVGQNQFPGAPDVVEDGSTFEANALKKAVTLARFTGILAMADDSGLEVDALDGAPGVWSARYAGEPVDHRANIVKLLAAMEGVDERAARFRCVLALADPSGGHWTVEGRCEGRIANAPRGSNGFGYDPVFIPEGENRTFAEMSDEEKNLISHRARALAAAHVAWESRLKD